MRMSRKKNVLLALAYPNVNYAAKSASFRNNKLPEPTKHHSKSARVRVAFFSFEQPERMAGSDEGAEPVPYAELVVLDPLPEQSTTSGLSPVHG